MRTFLTRQRNPEHRGCSAILNTFPDPVKNIAKINGLKPTVSTHQANRISQDMKRYHAEMKRDHAEPLDQLHITTSVQQMLPRTSELKSGYRLPRLAENPDHHFGLTNGSQRTAAYY